jgi:GTP cyclohydrolase IA
MRGINGRTYTRKEAREALKVFHKNFIALQTFKDKPQGEEMHVKKRYLANENQFNKDMGMGDVMDRKVKLVAAFENVLDACNFDWTTDPNMKDTPARLARMYMEETFSGCYKPEPRFTVFPNTKKYDELILMKDIRIVSTCSHHIQPFTGICHIGYLPSPKGLICGASKLVRIAHWFALRPQIQEELTAQIAEYLMKKLKPLGVVVIIEAQHGCMTNRGVKEYNAKMVTSKLLGVFKTNPAARQEALVLIKN